MQIKLTEANDAGHCGSVVWALQFFLQAASLLQPAVNIPLYILEVSSRFQVSVIANKH